MTITEGPQPLDLAFNPAQPRDAHGRWEGGHSGMRSRLGRCYELAGNYVMEHPGTSLVHGSIQGMGNPRIGHAWVKTPDGGVWEPATDQVFPAPAFNSFFNAREGAVYSRQEAMSKMSDQGTYGPWGGTASPPVGLAAQLAAPRLVSEQVLDLAGWKDAWLHEARGPHGEWVKGTPGGTSALVAIPSESHGFQGKFTGRDTFIPSLKPAVGTAALTSRGRPDGTGTADDPIDVQGNIDRAVLLMAQGKHVRLNQVDEVSTLMSKVNQLADDYDKRGLKMPKWDMGKISVAGTNLFTAQTKGIPRIEMPQLSGPAQPGSRAAGLAGGDGKFIELDKQFRDQLTRDGISVTDQMVPTSHLRATQKELTASTVAGIARAAEQGNPKVLHMLKEPLWVTRDNYIIDGHHRWAAQMLLDARDGVLGNDTVTQVHRVNMDIGAAIPYANQFAQDWGIAQVGLGNNKLVQAANDGPAVDLGHHRSLAAQLLLAEDADVPADPAAVALFTAHRVGDTLHALANAAQRMKAARAASGDLRAHHSDAVREHLADALEHGHQLVAHLRGHYPAEAGELEQVRQHIGLAKAVNAAAKTATTAHLLETVLHEETHGIRHADAMTDADPEDDEVWGFNADHAEKHLSGAVEHAGKLADHFRDNYPQVGKWLPRPAAGGGKAQHARYSGTAQLTALITAQLDLTGDGHGHHIPGTPMVYKHGWKPIDGITAQAAAPARESLAEPIRASMPAPARKTAAAARRRTAAALHSLAPGILAGDPQVLQDRAQRVNTARGRALAQAQTHATFADVGKAVAESKIYTATEMQRMQAQLNQLQKEMEGENLQHKRAASAVKIGIGVAGVIFSAMTAGLGLPIAGALAAAALPIVGSELADYHIGEKGRVTWLSHPVSRVKTLLGHPPAVKKAPEPVPVAPLPKRRPPPRRSSPRRSPQAA